MVIWRIHQSETRIDFVRPQSSVNKPFAFIVLYILYNSLLIQLFQICYIHNLTMKKIIALAFLVLALSALEPQQTHQQAKPAATPAPASHPATPPPNNKPPAQTPKTPAPAPRSTPAPAPVKIQRQPHKEPGHEAKPGNPFGQNPLRFKTCFSPPCFDPVGFCKISTSKRRVRALEGTWKAVVYLVRVNGKRAKFGGYKCA